jgi:phosphoribosyl-AMP cyclohydrolase
VSATDDLKWDAQGLIPAVVQDTETGQLLMVAWMSPASLEETRRTGLTHFWSRSRNALWRKGESSGHTQRVVEMRTDCDQDAVWIRVEQVGAACHTGRRSCFYRKVEGEGGKVSLAFVDAERVFDPNAVYRK